MNKANQVRFSEKNFLVTNLSLEVVLGMSFLTLSNADVDFSGRELWWKTYTTKKALLMNRRIKLMEKKKFAAIILDPEYKIYVVYVMFFSLTSLIASLRSTLLNIYPSRRSQIFDLIAKEALTKVFNKYVNFADVFSLDLASKLSKYTGINNHTIKLVSGQ